MHIRAPSGIIYVSSTSLGWEPIAGDLFLTSTLTSVVFSHINIAESWINTRENSAERSLIKVSHNRYVLTKNYDCF